MSEIDHGAAWVAALNIALSPNSGFDFDDVPSPPPNKYAAITVTRRYGSTRRMPGGRVMDGWRLTTTEVGRTVDEARWVRDLIHTHLEDVALSTLVATPLRFETSTPIGKDADDLLGLYVGVTTWTYHAPAL